VSVKYTPRVPCPTKQAAKDSFVAFLATKNLRMTSQRQAIIESVFNTEEHFTAEQLLEWSRARDKSVSRATVYRTLPLLTESGLVREMDFGKDHKFYDPNYAAHPEHNHIVCADCEKIVEFDSAEISEIEKKISSKLGFALKSQRLQITATCQELKKRGTCTKKGC
jgi:Fur family transcriptional regulator, ferric uptake regulator